MFNQTYNEMKTIVLLSLFMMIIPTLSGQSGNNSKVTVLNLAESFSKPQEVSLSLFVDKISYISLESNPEVMISNYASFEVTDEFVIVRQSGADRKFQILVFDRGTGKFIREIGKQGRGPGEFSIYSTVPFNKVKKQLYAISSSGELLAYDLSGNNTDRISIPKWTDPQIPKQTNSNSTIDRQVVLITADNMLDSNIFVGYVVNFSGWEKRKMALFSKDEVLKVFPNYLTYSREDMNSFPVPPPGGYDKFYRWDNKLNFIEAFCDTLYQVTKSSMIPRYFFNWGKYNAPYSKQEEIHSSGKWDDYFFLKDIDENKNYIFIMLSYGGNNYTAFVEKRTNTITFCKKGNQGNSALVDDISGLMDVLPQAFTEKNEMIYIIQPAKLFNWFKENPEQATQARTKLSWLKNIDEFSNPVIAIAKCKD